MKKIALCYDFDGTLCSGYMKIKNLFQIVKNNYEADFITPYLHIQKRTTLSNLLEPWFNGGDDIIVEVDGDTFTSQDFIHVQLLSQIIINDEDINKEELPTKFEFAIITLGASSCVLKTPTGFPLCTNKVSLFSNSLRVFTIAS